MVRKESEKRTWVYANWQGEHVLPLVVGYRQLSSCQFRLASFDVPVLSVSLRRCLRSKYCLVCRARAVASMSVDWSFWVTCDKAWLWELGFGLIPVKRCKECREAICPVVCLSSSYFASSRGFWAQYVEQPEVKLEPWPGRWWQSALPWRQPRWHSLLCPQLSFLPGRVLRLCRRQLRQEWLRGPWHCQLGPMTCPMLRSCWPECQEASAPRSWAWWCQFQRKMAWPMVRSLLSL